MIEVERVNKRFGDQKALQDVSLAVHQGSIYGLVGCNGAGKTTLLKLLAGVYKADAGLLMIDSQPVFENEAIKARTVFIPDTVYSFHNYTVQDMANFYARIYPHWSQQRYQQLAQVFNIETQRRIKTLSKGMQRQVAFWLALSLMPDVMILDEPLDGLDPVMRQKVKHLIIQDVAERGVTVMISSHNLRELEDVCDHIGILHQGKMLIQKDLDDLKADIHKIQIAFSSEIPPTLLEESQALHHEQRGSVMIIIVRGAHGEIISKMQAYQPAVLDVLPLTLEEIFIYEMGDYGHEIQNIFY
ncbi:MAG: ABC transporter ATP-binding protein [Syntrophomonadaceae bacterium]|jgi:ABC-2 type transport system ATP-binding protein